MKTISATRMRSGEKSGELIAPGAFLPVAEEYGGFTYLKQLPIDYLKIDTEFVRDLRENAASRNVVRGIVNLAHGFGLRTIGEGVDDQDTLDLLREFGVDFAQGYHIGRPSLLQNES